MNLINNTLKLFVKDNLIDNLNKKIIFPDYIISCDFDNYSLADKDDFILTFIELLSHLKEPKMNMTLKLETKSLEFPQDDSENSYMLKCNDDEKKILKIFEKLKDEKYELENNISKFTITMRFTHNPDSKIHRIIDFDIFKNYLLSKNLEEIIIQMPKFINFVDREDYVFLINKDIKEFYTNSIYFIHDIGNYEKYKKREEIEEKKVLIDKYHDFSIFNGHNLLVTPKDFNLIVLSEDNLLNEKFNSIKQILSIIYLSKNSRFSSENKNIIYSQINGYKNITIKINYLKEKYNNDIFYKIFLWSYFDKNYLERLEISANIISLDYKNSMFDLDENTLNSIKSNYQIYSKENVERYISLKSSIIENVISIVFENAIVLKEMSSRTLGILGANLTFFLSIIVINLIENSDKILFNKELTIISIFVIFISAIILLGLSCISNRNIVRFVDQTIQLKNTYSKLLNPEDLNVIIDNFYDLKVIKEYQRDICMIGKFGVLILTFIFMALICISEMLKVFLLTNKILCLVCSIVVVIIFKTNSIIFKHYNDIILAKKISSGANTNLFPTKDPS